MNFLALVGSLLGTLMVIGGLMVSLTTVWQAHLHRSQRQCERMAEHVAVLERLVYAEHPEYSSWIQFDATCEDEK